VQQGHSELTCNQQRQLPQGHRQRFSNNRKLRTNGYDGCLEQQQRQPRK